MIHNNSELILGETQKEIQIETAEDNRNIAISLAKQAHMSIDIFTQDMDSEIYNSNTFEQYIFSLARQNPKTLVRILALDTKSAVQSGHCIIRLAQHLTSSVLIHNPSQDDMKIQKNFMVVDKTGVIYRAASSRKNYVATASFNSPQRAIELGNYFNELWQRSSPDAQTRRLYV